MKYINLIFITIITTSIFNACGPNDRKYYNTSSAFSPSIIVDSDKLYFQYYSGNNKEFTEDKNESLLFEFNSLTHQWEKVASRRNSQIETLNDFNSSKAKELYKPFDSKDIKNIIEVGKSEYITFHNKVAIVKNIDTNKTTFTQVMPSTKDILDDLFLAHDSIDYVEYLPFITKQYEWDRKRYIIMAATNKNKNNNHTQYFLSAYYNNDSWEYHLVDTKHDAYTSNSNINTNIGSYRHISLDGKVNLGSIYGNRQFYMLNKISNQIELKELFTDIYSQGFLKIIESIYSFSGNEHYNGSRGNYIFDEKGNMHLFYRKREDIRSHNHDYFWYAYFEKENPTTALYEQKIEWE